MKKDYLKIISELNIDSKTFKYFDLNKLSSNYPEIKNLPFSIRILLENVIRNFDDFSIKKKHINSILNWKKFQGKKDIPYSPTRVLMQDFTGVPAVVDLASMREALFKENKDPKLINPLVKTDLVVDHSINVEFFGTKNSLKKNVEIEYQKNKERYELLKWAQTAFKNFNVVPPGMGICHQINLEYLSECVRSIDGFLVPDTLVGTDSHTPMVNGIGVLGWGVGGIEAEAAMLGQPIFMILPEVIGLKLIGKLNDGITTTDLVLSITEKLRNYGVVGKIVEVIGEGAKNLSVTDRATISNMSPEFGCTDTHWPIDNKTLEYLKKSNRSKELINRVEIYSKKNLLWNVESENIEYTDIIEFNLSNVTPTISGPKKPQEKIQLNDAKIKIDEIIKKTFKSKLSNQDITNGSIVLAAITSCTNTSNPSVMIGAGLIAKKAIEYGIKVKPWVKTSLAPGSKVVTEYLKKSNLLKYLEKLGFNIVGYGCTTCIGNSGDFISEVQKNVIENDLTVASVLSGNRNFEARIHPNIKMNFLMSPMFVVLYSLIGKINVNPLEFKFSNNKNGKKILFKDLWPSNNEIEDLVNKMVTKDQFKNTYSNIFEGDSNWRKLKFKKTNLFDWKKNSTYIKEVSFFKNVKKNNSKEINARILLKLGDSVTTDHISPAGKFLEEHPAGIYLKNKNINKNQFNSYGSRRGNEEIMVRGTFANVRLKNELVNTEGGWTIYHPNKKELSVYDAAKKYQKNNIDTVVFAGKEYGSGSSRDWAAKGTNLLGIKAVIAKSFERIHRSNLIGMGILPIEINNIKYDSSKIIGNEFINIKLGEIEVRKELIINIKSNKKNFKIKGLLRIDSEIEIEYYKEGGILNYVLKKLINNSKN